MPLEVEPRSLEKRKKHWVGTGNGLRTRINIKAHHTNSFGLFGIAIAFALAFILRIRYIWLRLRVGKTPNYALRCMDRVWCNFLTYTLQGSDRAGPLLYTYNLGLRTLVGTTSCSRMLELRPALSGA